MKEATPNHRPICGEGILVVLRHDEEPQGKDQTVRQEPEPREAVAYDRGHTLIGTRLSTADADALDAERRTSDETVSPGPGESTVSAQERARPEPPFEVHCVACGDRWDPTRGRSHCRCGRSRARMEDTEIVLHGPVEAVCRPSNHDAAVVTAGSNDRWPPEAPAVRRQHVPPLI
jgi:hypothetical protein